MKKPLTQFGKELRDSTQSIISKEVLEFLHTTSLTDEDVTYLTKTISEVGFDNENNIRKLCYLISNSYLPLQTIDKIFEELRDGFYFDSYSKHSIGILSHYFKNTTFANLIPMFDEELVGSNENIDFIFALNQFYENKLDTSLKLLVMLKEIQTDSERTMNTALSHANPFEDSLGDWSDVYNQNERVNELISEILKLTYQKEEEK